MIKLKNLLNKNVIEAVGFMDPYNTWVIRALRGIRFDVGTNEKKFVELEFDSLNDFKMALKKLRKTLIPGAKLEPDESYQEISIRIP